MGLLALVVAAGLVMGSVAFRTTAGGGAAAAATAGKAVVGDPNAPHPSAADEVVDPQPESAPMAGDAPSANGEPGVPTKESPEMQGPTDGDPPGTVTPPSAPPEDASPQ